MAKEVCAKNGVKNVKPKPLGRKEVKENGNTCGADSSVSTYHAVRTMDASFPPNAPCPK